MTDLISEKWWRRWGMCNFFGGIVSLVGSSLIWQKKKFWKFFEVLNSEGSQDKKNQKRYAHSINRFEKILKKEAYAEIFMQKFDLEPIKVEIDPYFGVFFGKIQSQVRSPRGNDQSFPIQK